MDFIPLLLKLLILFISAIPLCIAVNMLGGRAGIFITMLVNIGAGILGTIIKLVLPISNLSATIITMIALLAVYMVIFDLGFIRAFFAWVLQFVIAFLFVLILGLFGIAVAMI